MEYRRLGKASLKVSPICLGAGGRGPLDEARFVRTIEHAITTPAAIQDPPVIPSAAKHP